MIDVYEHKIFLPEQPYRWNRIQNDTDIHDPTIVCGNYNLNEKAHNGYIFVRVTKGMYRLPQSVQIEHDDIVKQLEPYVYRP